MKRSSLFVCCGITLLYLSDRLDSRTVAPIVYLTTAIPNVADPNGYYDDGDVGGRSEYHHGAGVGGGQSGYYGGGAGGKAGYYSGSGGQPGYYGGSGGQPGYYGGSGGQSRSYGGVGPTGHYGGRSPTAAATTYGSYGHRTMPESAVRGAIHPVRDEGSHALYESPNTYEYMRNPPRKSGKVSRVPETERLPPGDDVEFIDDGGGGNNRQSQDDDDRPRRGHQPNNNGKRINKNKHKSGRQLPARNDDYANDGVGGVGGGDAEPVGSSNTGDVREGATAKKPRREEVGRKNKYHVPSGDGPVKHKIHKKNEYSKKQQFFDEEHVDHGKKKPAKNKSNHGGGHKNGGQELRKRSKKKQQQQPQQQQRSTQKPIRRTTKREQKDDRGTSRVVPPQGYGQVVAVR